MEIVYHFELNKERTKLNIDSAVNHRLDEKIIFAKGFGKSEQILKLDLMAISTLFRLTRVKYLE